VNLQFLQPKAYSFLFCFERAFTYRTFLFVIKKQKASPAQM